MQAFVAVADLQGFALAARKLALSPSAVTRLIAGLEDRLGARLLQRTTRKVALTDAGARYLERARRILADLEEAEDSVESERTALRRPPRGLGADRLWPPARQPGGLGLSEALSRRLRTCGCPDRMINGGRRR